jgi:hypothetical protein
MKAMPRGPAFSAAWGVVALVLSGGAVAIGLNALPARWKFPAWLAWVFVALTIAALCMCFASLFRKHPISPQMEDSEIPDHDVIEIIPEQDGNYLRIGLRNTDYAAEVSAQITRILNPLGQACGPQHWPIPWHEDNSVEPKRLLRGQTRTLDFAYYDSAAVNDELRSGHQSGDHWKFSSIPTPIGARYYNPRCQKDLEEQYFTLTVRIMNASSGNYCDWDIRIRTLDLKLICEITLLSPALPIRKIPHIQFAHSSERTRETATADTCRF